MLRNIFIPKKHFYSKSINIAVSDFITCLKLLDIYVSICERYLNILPKEEKNLFLVDRSTQNTILNSLFEDSTVALANKPCQISNSYHVKQKSFPRNNQILIVQFVKQL